MDKDIRFAEKKVDSSWKDQAQQEQLENETLQKTQKPSEKQKNTRTSPVFLNFITSLGIQVLMNLGEYPQQEVASPEINLEAAREILDLLIEIKEKTDGNLSEEEAHFFHSFIPELQLKYASKA